MGFFKNHEYTPSILNVANSLQNGAYIDYQDGEGNTALIYALSRQYDAIAEYLLNQGANPLLQNKKGLKAIDMAVKNSAIYDLILAKEKEEKQIDDYSKGILKRPNPTNESSIYDTRIEAEKREVYKKMELDHLNKELIEEVKKYDASTSKIKELLWEGAEIDYPCPEDGSTALMFATELQNERIVDCLLKQGANPLVTNFWGEIASDLIPSNSSIYARLKKREKECRFEFLPKKDKYSLLLQEYICEPIVKMQKIDEFLALGADVNYQRLDGSTALIIAADDQNERVVEYLLRNGANPFLKINTVKLLEI